MTGRPLCAHGYHLGQDSCSNCGENDTGHPADPVTVTPAWSDTPRLMCRLCGRNADSVVHIDPVARVKNAADARARLTALHQVEPRTVTQLREGRNMYGWYGGHHGQYFYLLRDGRHAGPFTTQVTMSQHAIRTLRGTLQEDTE